MQTRAPSARRSPTSKFLIVARRLRPRHSSSFASRIGKRRLPRTNAARGGSAPPNGSTTSPSPAASTTGTAPLFLRVYWINWLVWKAAGLCKKAGFFWEKICMLARRPSRHQNHDYTTTPSGQPGVWHGQKPPQRATGRGWRHSAPSPTATELPTEEGHTETIRIALVRGEALRKTRRRVLLYDIGQPHLVCTDSV